MGVALEVKELRSLVIENYLFYYRLLQSNYLARFNLLIQAALFFLFSIIFGWFLLEYPFSFNYSIKNNDHYKLAFLLPIFPAILIMKIYSKDKVYLKTLALLNFLLICYCALLFSRFYTISNEHFFVVLSIVSLIWSINYVLGRSCIILILPIIAAYFAEAIAGLYQISFVHATTINGFLNISGSFNNSGVYACYLIIGIPFLYYFLFHFNDDLIKVYKDKKLGVFFYQINFFYKKYSKIFSLARWTLFFLVIVFCICVLFVSQSRTAIISLAITIIAMLLFKENCRIKLHLKSIHKTFKWVLAISIFIISSVILFNLFYLKEQSSFGRLLMWQVAVEHIKDHFWFGAGLGRFTWYYPQWQSMHFQTHINPSKEQFLNAGESYILMNEYLQLFEEVGFWGFACFGFMIYYFFSSKSYSYPHLLNSFKVTVIAILGCGFSSYPFHVNSLLFLLCFCFAAGFVLRENKSWIDYTAPDYLKHLKNALLIILILLSACVSYAGLQAAIAVNRWQLFRNDNVSFNKKFKYAFLYQALHKNGKFLTEYGECLLREGDFQNACRILEEAKQYFISFETIRLTGLAYKQAKNYPKSIENFEWLENYIPNHFGTKYELLQLYKQSGNIIAAQRIGSIILNMPVKIPSFQVDGIKTQTKQILISLQR
jgi:tetratricopeptide (TPR) repeat protein